MKRNEQRPIKITYFKFLNSVTNMKGFLQVVSNNQGIPLIGRAMYVVWKKLQRLQPIIRGQSKTLSDIKLQLEKVRNDLIEAHQSLLQDKMNSKKIERAKRC